MADLPVPESPPPPPGEPRPPSQRVSDADRDRTVTELRENVVDGRLTLDEFSERVGTALQAKVQGDLLRALADLPDTQSAERLPDAATSSSRQQRRWHVAVMSGHSTKGRWRISGKTNAVAIMGGCDMDLRRAEIDGPEVEITAFAFWGGIDITVPEGFDVELRGFSFMGGRSLKLRDVPIIPGSPRIVVRGFAVMGGIDVKSRPNRFAKTKQLARSAVRRALEVPDPVSDRTELAALEQDIKRDLPADGTVTILFCDMVDYAGMTERLGDQRSRAILAEHHRIVRDAIARHGGREISVQGDGFMVAFGGVARGLRTAIDIQRAVSAHVPADPDEGIAVHIGVHTGDVQSEGDDYLGHTVIVASRLADTAGPGEVLVSSLSEQLVQGSGEFIFDGHRETHLKGMERAQMSATLSWAE